MQPHIGPLAWCWIRLMKKMNNWSDRDSIRKIETENSMAVEYRRPCSYDIDSYVCIFKGLYTKIDSRNICRQQAREDWSPTYRLHDLMGKDIKGRFYATEVQLITLPHCIASKRYSTHDVDTTVQSNTTWNGWVFRRNLILGSQKLPMPPKKLSDDILMACQIITSFLIVIVALINLSLTDRDKALWSTLLGAGFGYLVPNPKLKRIRTNNDDRFTIILPSNTSMDLYPQNVVSNFTHQTKCCVGVEWLGYKKYRFPVK